MLESYYPCLLKEKFILLKENDDWRIFYQGVNNVWNINDWNATTDEEVQEEDPSESLKEL